MAARILAAGSVLAALAQASPVHNNGTTGGIVYTTEIVQSLVTYCPAPTTIVQNSKTYTVTEATTLTISDCPCTVSKPVAPTATPSKPSKPEDKCAKECYDAYNACRVKPQANMSFCAAQYASCLGYSPFGDDGSLITPSACSAQPPATATNPGHPVYTTEVVTQLTTWCPEPTTMTFNNKTYTVTEPTTLTVTNCPCTISKPHPSASQPATPDCPTECSNAYNMCRGSAGANMATCAAKYASCLGYSPFDESGSLVTPTACSKPPAGPTTVPGTVPGTAPGTKPATVPGSLPVTVPGTKPATAPGTTPTAPAATPPPNSGAGRIVPGALLALGAVALL
ncbi:Clock-controlled protein 6 [Paramyrothecium foliicola]|nr:Clock-controlled protein 6 [Paramyrothecium foliicola]